MVFEVWGSDLVVCQLVLRLLGCIVDSCYCLCNIEVNILNGDKKINKLKIMINAILFGY